MFETQIKIQSTANSSRQSPRSVDAWFVPGRDLRRWVREISNWRTQHHLLNLIVVPTSKANRTPIGLLVTGRVPTRENVGAGCLPFVAASDQLWIPASAELVPMLDQRELQSLLVDDSIYVWHPACGLVVSSDDEQLRMSDLFSVQPAGSLEWNDADSGVVLASRLTSVSATEPPSADEILQEGGGDIGENASDIQNLSLIHI